MKTRFLTMKRAASKAFVCGITLLALLAFVLPQAAQADTAANTVIRNTATVTYQDTAGTAMPAVSDTLDITVAFVCATPTLSQPTDITITPDGTAVYTYTITTGANGPDNYDLSAAVTSVNGVAAGSTAATSVSDVDLGATSAQAAAAIGANSITVPNDAASNSSINGIEANDMVVIGGVEYTVASITDNGGTVGGTSTITLATTLTADVSVGDPIWERKTFTVTVDPGALTTPVVADPTVTVTTTADGDTGSCGNATDETITHIIFPQVTVKKEVSADGTTWYDNNAQQFAPNSTVYYRITVNNEGTSNATSIVLTDAQPPYTTYDSGSARYTIGAAAAYSAATSLTDAAGGDPYGSYDFNITTANTATYSFSPLAPGVDNQVQLFFTVTLE